ncbi:MULTISPECIES: hypothetical protein [Mycolicibacterium]|jgi:hypothetical protein|uniref:ESX-1 secretion-associated protein EspH n=1 Tax=Mycolicibacterium conceptionense TaxID=451644 RepID=A0A0U1DS74_9MYCO|nr:MULTISPECIES: hypothetical protein [Mycolicibacterium]OBJ92499.1 hypothetical protein A5639_08510 [Mycolicibacterium conceptionense]OMB78925.1 hypothetical protein A5741_28460 [Mycolicibacterium conceptionense]OMC01370.1 hypothetical protein A5746_11500 [Mycolicibacterium conceptionense]ORV29096.1 hypothetical protein AWB98_06830 [Mycolicibacterium conceptionense]QZH59877.1 hypothetical protein K1X22_27680 [Mycolicibacterium farcinogenes]
MTDHTWDDDDPDDGQFPSGLDALDFGGDDGYRREEHDDFAGLDVFTADEIPGGSAVYFDEPAVPGHPVVPEHEDSDNMSSGPVTFGVTNPAGTITAQATISGAINRVELSPSITSMTESDLARDIVATARLADLQGRAIQRAMIQSLLMQQGLDQDVASRLIDDIVDLPTPAQAEAAQAEAVAEYMRGEH